jgi:predicted transcriptional regulator
MERLGKLQLQIMRVLWEHGEGTVTDVHAALLETHGLAPTTIATMLKKMEAKGVVEHRTEGRRFVYSPTVSQAEVTKTMVADLADRLFDGSAAALASHLIEEHEVQARELDALRGIITRAKRKERG